MVDPTTWVLLIVVVTSNGPASTGITSQALYFTDKAACFAARDEFATSIGKIPGTAGYSGCRPTGAPGPTK